MPDEVRGLKLIVCVLVIAFIAMKMASYGDEWQVKDNHTHAYTER